MSAGSWRSSGSLCPRARWPRRRPARVGRRLRPFDDEIAYIAATLHDLGLTGHAHGERRFEVDGADAARTWALSSGMSTCSPDLS